VHHLKVPEASEGDRVGLVIVAAAVVGEVVEAAVDEAAAVPPQPSILSQRSALIEPRETFFGKRWLEKKCLIKVFNGRTLMDQGLLRLMANICMCPLDRTASIALI